MVANRTSATTILRWPALLPYLLTGLAPFGLGTLLVRASGLPIQAAVFGAGAAAVAALFVAAWGSRAAFAPEVGRWPGRGWLTPDRAKGVAYASLVLAAALGVWLQVSGRAGLWTIPLGGLGILGGYFYFAPPLMLGQRGLGEAVGALGLGLLPVGGGFYLQSGQLVTEILVYGIPLTLVAFNHLLIHGFPNPEAPEAAGRQTLAERLGLVGGALVYTVVNILVIGGLVFCLFYPASPLPSGPGLWVLILLALLNQELIKRKAYRQERRIRILCNQTLILHLGLCLVFALGLWERL